MIKMITLIAVITSLLLIGLFISTKCNSSFFNWFSYVGYIALLLIPVNIVLSLILALRKRWVALLPIAALLINYNGYAALLRPQVESQTGAKKVIKVMTYNVHNFNYGGESRLPEISSYLRQNEIDVICFQEYLEGYQFKADSMRKIFFNFGYAATSFTIETEKHNYGQAIYSRYPIVDSGQIPLGTSNGNGAMWADIAIDGDTVRVICAHLQTTGVSQNEGELRKAASSNDTEGAGRVLLNMLSGLDNNTKVRIEQAKSVNQMIETSPYSVIMCGDFNDMPLSHTYELLTKHLVDGFKDAGGGYAYTFRRFKALRIDYILYSPKLKGVSNISPDLEWSDHNPVVATIAIE